MMFTPYEFDDDSMTLRSEDPGDIARVLRMLGIELPRRIARPTAIYVTIHQPLLTEENCHAKINEDSADASSDTLELPF